MVNFKSNPMKSNPTESYNFPITPNPTNLNPKSNPNTTNMNPSNPSSFQGNETS